MLPVCDDGRACAVEDSFRSRVSAQALAPPAFKSVKLIRRVIPEAALWASYFVGHKRMCPARGRKRAGPKVAQLLCELIHGGHGRNLEDNISAERLAMHARPKSTRRSLLVEVDPLILRVAATVDSRMALSASIAISQSSSFAFTIPTFNVFGLRSCSPVAYRNVLPIWSAGLGGPFPERTVFGTAAVIEGHWVWQKPDLSSNPT